MLEKRIEVRRFHKFWNVAIFNLRIGGSPRVRTAMSKPSLNRIMREEDIEFHPGFGKVKTEVIHLDRRA